MKIDKHRQHIFNEADLMNAFMEQPYLRLTDVLMDDPVSFAKQLYLDDLPRVHKYESEEHLSQEEFDEKHSTTWFMPDEYKSMDILSHVVSLAKTEAELNRVAEELLMYQERDMLDLLRYLKYLVDIMRDNNILWGVGRGSSVSSYVLYLLGVHRIDSIKYNLDIADFLH